MKPFLISSFVFLSLISYADKFYEATITFTDNSTRTGFVENMLGSYIQFKSSKNAKVEEIESSSLKSIVLKIEKEAREYHYLKVYKEWGQTKIDDPSWIRVVEKGIAL